MNIIKYLQESTKWFAGAALLLLAAACASTPSGPVDRVQLSTAIGLDDVSRLRSLVGAKVIGVDDVIPGIGYTATPIITVAARHGSINVLRYLIAARADVNARTPDRDTPLMLAALFGREELEHNTAVYQRYDLAVRLLIEAGASLENSEPNTYTALAYAAYAGRDNTVRYLLEKGAKANANAQGRLAYVNTPLMMAAMQGNRNAALQLLRAGADATVRVQNGMTARELAQKNNQAQLENLLRCAESLQPGDTFRQRCE